MSPTGNKKCSYAPMQKQGLIAPALKNNKERDDFVSKFTADNVNPETSLEKTMKLQNDAVKFYNNETQNIGFNHL